MSLAAWPRGLAAAAALLASAAALALPETRPEPTPAVACARVKAGEPPLPEYPLAEYKARKAGRVQATVTLPGGLFGPQVELTSDDKDGPFEAEVRRWLRTLEAPCLGSGETARLSYDFVFEPDRREVVWDEPRDANELRHKEVFACLKHVDGEKMPDYPAELRRKLQQGRVFALLRFDGPDTPPVLEMFQRQSAVGFRGPVGRWVAGLRLPCHPGQGPEKARMVFVFRVQGESAYGFKPMRLLELLALGKGIRERALVLDTTQMGCPFDLRFTYTLPARPNGVGQVGTSDARRRPLLELLRKLELDLPARSLDAVFADTADVAVPCLRLNLNPQEKKS